MVPAIMARTDLPASDHETQRPMFLAAYQTDKARRDAMTAAPTGQAIPRIPAGA